MIDTIISEQRCKEKEKGATCPCLPAIENPYQKSLVLELFELRRELAANNIVTFKASGTCMYPLLKPGDILTIEPKETGEIQIGDIAVFRRHNNLFAHRVIEKGIANGAPYVVTRPDSASYGSDGQNFEQDIVGVVNKVERRGMTFSASKKENRTPHKIKERFLLTVHNGKQYLYAHSVEVITYIQRFIVYRIIARFLFSLWHKKIDFSFCAPLNSRTASLFRKISEDEINVFNLNANRDMFPGLNIALKVNAKLAGSLSLVFNATNCALNGWWISEIDTRIRYRSTGIEERMLKKVEELFGLAHVPLLYARVRSDVRPERALFRKIGFEEMYSSNGVIVARKTIRGAA